MPDSDNGKRTNYFTVISLTALVGLVVATTVTALVPPALPGNVTPVLTALALHAIAVVTAILSLHFTRH